MFLLSITLFIGVTAMAMYMSAEFSVFYNWPSLIIVIPVSLAFSMAITSLSTFKQAFSIVLSDGAGWSQSQLTAASHVFEAIGKSAVLMGWFGVIIGAVAMASDIDKTEFADVIGPATAVCLLTLLYGYALNIVCFSASSRIQYFATKVIPESHA